MAWRKTATFHAPVEVLVLTCDVCACDIGHEDERRPRAHFQLSRHPNPGAIDDQEPWGGDLLPGMPACFCRERFRTGSRPTDAPAFGRRSKKRATRTQSCTRLRVSLFRNGCPTKR